MITLKDIIQNYNIDDNTEIIIRNIERSNILASGHRYDKAVLALENRELACLEWEKEGNKILVVIDVVAEELKVEGENGKAFKRMMDAYDVTAAAIDNPNINFMEAHKEFIEKMEAFEKVAGVTEEEVQRLFEEELERRKEK